MASGRRAIVTTPASSESPGGAAMTRLLTPRQIELLALLAEGLTMRAAAATMHIATDRAYSLRSNAFDRLNVSSPPEAWQALGWLKVPA